jgi:GNAT superfamily N-acetyltransferase
MSVSILPFQSKYSKNFKDLNVAWLDRYFYVEPKDTVLLEDCENSIINKNGFIFFAEYQNEIVGCFSLIKIEDNLYELGKMAVDPKFQGLRIGQELLKFAIDFGKENNWNKIILYSNTKLEHALYLYRKYGFQKIELEKELPYARSDIKMELLLK